MCSNRRYRPLLAGLLTGALLLIGCGEQAPVQEEDAGAYATPTPRPTAEPTIQDVLDGAQYTLTLDGELFAIESFALQDTEAGLVVYSELRTAEGLALLQRRTLLLSAANLPLTYELEERAGGARSLWLAERSGESLSVLNDDLNLPVPVMVDGVTPVPAILRERRPSALPYVLAAWRLASAEGGQLELSCLDITEPLPAVQTLTLGPASLTTGQVIGAEGYHGSIADAANGEFDLWLRGSGALVRAQVDDYRWDWSALQVWPDVADGQTLVIQRVTELPELASGEPTGEIIGFVDATGRDRQALLRLPEGEGPFPVGILLGPEGLRPAWRAGDALLSAGWATVSYLPRGLGDADASYERGAYAAWGEDAAALAAALAQRQDLDAGRVLLIGWREGTLVAAQALTSPDAPLAGAVLLAPPATGTLFPSALTWRIEQVLAPAYGWDPEQTQRYTELSVDQARDWLFDDVEEITALGRRVEVGYLRDYAGQDLGELLGASRQPVLLIPAAASSWADPAVAGELAAGLQADGRGAVSLASEAPTLWDGQELTADAAALITSWAAESLP